MAIELMPDPVQLGCEVDSQSGIHRLGKNLEGCKVARVEKILLVALSNSYVMDESSLGIARAYGPMEIS